MYKFIFERINNINSTENIKENLPLKALPIRELVQDSREKVFPIILKTELTITDVHNSGDLFGIE